MQMNKCYFCGKECGETVLTVNDKTLFQSELFRAKWRKWKHADEALKLIGESDDEP